MSKNDVAVVWRNDGVIEYIISSDTLINTFFATVLRHDEWICELVNEFTLASTEDLAPQWGEMLTMLKEGLLGSGGAHGSLRVEESRLKAGTEDYLPGMFYGTMHPTELWMLASRAEEEIDKLQAMGMDQAQLGTIRCWGEAAKKFVRPGEALAAVAAEAGKA